MPQPGHQRGRPVLCTTELDTACILISIDGLVVAALRDTSFSPEGAVDRASASSTGSASTPTTSASGSRVSMRAPNEAGPAGEVNHPGVRSGDGLHKVDEHLEPLLTVREVGLLLRVPALQQLAGVATAPPE